MPEISFENLSQFIDIPSWKLQGKGVPLSIVLLGTLGILKIIHGWVNNAGKNTPPYVKYWIPWLGSAISLGKDPDGFFRRAKTELGPIFKVRNFGRDIIYITAPELISALFRDSKTFVFTPIRLEIAARIFGMSWKHLNSLCTDNEYFKVHQRELSPVKVPGIHRRYGKYAYECIFEALNNLDGGAVPLYSFIKPAAYHAASYAFFGKSFDSKASYEPFKKFDDMFYLLAAGLPLRLLREAYQSRSFLISLFKTYVTSPHEDCSELVQAIEGLAREREWALDQFAASLFSDLWAIQSNAVVAAYWVIALQLARPEGLQPLIDEVDAARRAGTDADPTHCEWILSGSFPLLTSTIMESLRIASSVMTIRVVEHDTVFAGYHFRKGQKVTCATREVHMDEAIHEHPRAFVPDRYMEGHSKFLKDGRPVPNHTMPFGGGVSMCEGRHFVLGELRIFTALLLTHVTINVMPGSKYPKYMTSHVGVGLMPPDGDLLVKISRREMA